ncbi:MAG: thymidine phosphorylase [Acidobacteriaceae bacterium]
MRLIDLIRKKRDGGELSPQEVAWVIAQYTADAIPDYQMSAWLMAALLRGLSPAELAALTHAMLHSGRVLDLSSLPGPRVDKHSTGGVGDKTSLIVAPIAAAAGLYVPMISGRGLGHTGGTLDKLEAIPGFNVFVSPEAMLSQLAALGVVMAGQTEDIAPADKRLYALRDVTGTVESPELICASIMSKKLAEGIDALVLDVKSGSGAFMKRETDARRLARLMIDTGERMGKRVAALLTDMDQPLGHAVGNALEVRECLAVLEGHGPPDVVELCSALTAWMLYAGGVVRSVQEGEQSFARLIADGSGIKKFRELCRAQGGNLDALPHARNTVVVPATAAGFVQHIDCERIGIASLVIGGGRERKEDTVDSAVGLILHKKVGDAVAPGETLCTLHYNSDARLSEAREMIAAAYQIGAVRLPSRPLIAEILTSANLAANPPQKET